MKSNNNFKEFNINNNYKPQDFIPIAFQIKDNNVIFIGHYISHNNRFYCISDLSNAIKGEDVIKWKYIQRKF